VDFSIITKYPLWFILFCLTLGGIYAFILYWNNKKHSEFVGWQVKGLAALRFVAVSVLAFLLLSPYIKHLEREVEPPIVLFAQDNSQSILLNKDSSFYKTDYLAQLEELKKQLSENYEVKAYTFGNELEEGGTIDYTAPQTDISKVIDDIENRYSNRNVGALILASDGIYNTGSNPLFVSSNFNFPIYSVILGDTSINKDLLLSKVVANKIAFKGNQFPISVAVNAQKLNGSKTTLNVSHNGKVVFSEVLTINTADYFKELPILLEATAVGLQKYTVTLSEVAGEMSTVNNSKSIYIDVLDGKEKILILANAPHPDVAAIKRNVELNQNYEVDVQLISNFKGNSAPYNLIIYHGIPNSAAQSARIKSELNNKSALFVISNQTSTALVNELKLGVTIESRGKQTNEVTGVLNPTFPLFKIEESTGKQLSYFPPLAAPFGNVVITKPSFTLLNQKISKVETQTPLWFFIQDESQKWGFILGEGLWRWSLSDYERNQTTANFQELLGKTVQYLSLKVDKSLFRVTTKNDFLANEDVVFDAELYNESYELVNDAEVSIVLKNQDGREYPFSFSPTNQKYYLNAGKLEVGEYSYIATVNYAGKALKETGTLSVLPIDVEGNNLQANFGLMQELSRQGGGTVYFPNQMEEIMNELDSREDITSVSYSQIKLSELINLKWIFFLILGLLALEWLVRKRNGSY